MTYHMHPGENLEAVLDNIDAGVIVASSHERAELIDEAYVFMGQRAVEALAEAQLPGDWPL